MSNSHLFLKSGFPRAPLNNGLGRYVCQLKRVTLKYCKNNGSSNGMRQEIHNFFIFKVNHVTYFFLLEIFWKII